VPRASAGGHRLCSQRPAPGTALGETREQEVFSRPPRARDGELGCVSGCWHAAGAARAAPRRVSRRRGPHTQRGRTLQGLQGHRTYLQLQKSPCWVLNIPAGPQPIQRSPISGLGDGPACDTACWERVSCSSRLSFGIKTCALTCPDPARPSGPVASLPARAAPGREVFCWAPGAERPAGFAPSLFTFKCFKEILRYRQNFS